MHNSSTGESLLSKKHVRKNTHCVQSELWRLFARIQCSDSVASHSANPVPKRNKEHTIHTLWQNAIHKALQTCHPCARPRSSNRSFLIETTNVLELQPPSPPPSTLPKPFERSQFYTLTQWSMNENIWRGRKADKLYKLHTRDSLIREVLKHRSMVLCAESSSKRYLWVSRVVIE